MKNLSVIPGNLAELFRLLIINSMLNTGSGFAGAVLKTGKYCLQYSWYSGSGFPHNLHGYTGRFGQDRSTVEERWKHGKSTFFQKNLLLRCFDHQSCLLAMRTIAKLHPIPWPLNLNADPNLPFTLPFY